MGMMGVFKWLRKDIGYRDRRRQSLSPRQTNFQNESYRNALQAFMDRRRYSSSVIETGTPNILDLNNVTLLTDNSNINDNNIEKTNDIENDSKLLIEKDSLSMPDVPRVLASEIFEIGSIAGTEDRYLELIHAEWENTRISLKRQTHPECRNAVKADIEILTKIRHPNVLMLMALTQTEEHGFVSILEPVDCTLYNYIHEQGEQISVRQMAKFAGKLTDALRHAHMRGYVHSAISPHCVYLAFGETVKLAGWELAVSANNESKYKEEYEDILRSEIIRWQAPELFAGNTSKETDIYGIALLIWEMCTMRIPWSGYDVSEVGKQYTQLKNTEHGIPLDICDSPPIIHSLLEIGLQIDPAKRSIDLNKIRRLLQGLEIEYEYKDKLEKIEKKEIMKTIVTPIVEHSTVTNCNTPSSTTQINQNTNSIKKSTQLDSKRMKTRPEENNLNEGLAETPNFKLNTPTENDRSRFFSSPCRSNKSDDMRSNSLDKKEDKEITKKVENVNPSNVSGLQSYNSYKKSQLIRISNNKYKKGLNKILSESNCSTLSVESSPYLNVNEDISVDTNPHVNLQRLKEILANKRERFFNDTETSQSPENIESCSKIESDLLAKVKSKDYEPHKPASHKTSLEKKFNKSPGSYDSPYISPNVLPNQPVGKITSNMKNAIMKPRPINSHPRGFFETSLWKKEKEIVISKMWKEDSNVTQTSAENTENFLPKLNELTKPLETCDVNNKSENVNVIKQNERNDRVVIENTTKSEWEQENDSLQVLKEALDRATEIICANNSIQNELDETYLLSHQSCDNINTITNNTYTKKPFMDKTYKLTYTEDIGEGRKKELDNTLNKNQSIDKELNSNDRKNISENLNDCKIINDTTTIDKETEDGIYKANIYFLNNSFYDSDTIKSNDKKLSQEKYKENIFTSMSNDEKENLELSSKNCCKCNNKLTLRRRFSLPAIITHNKQTGNHSHLRKLPIRKADNSSNTSIEDFYIDDDNLELRNLNINMVLLDDDEIFYDNYFLNKLRTS